MADFVGTTNLFEGTVSALRAGHGPRALRREPAASWWSTTWARFALGQQVWVALRPEKIRLSKEPSTGSPGQPAAGMVWELGYLGNRSTYRIKTSSGKLVTVFAQNERRTSEWSIDWSDEVFVSWSADAAVVLQS